MIFTHKLEFVHGHQCIYRSKPGMGKGTGAVLNVHFQDLVLKGFKISELRNQNTETLSQLLLVGKW